jgi:hypothetical protein
MKNNKLLKYIITLDILKDALKDAFKLASTTGVWKWAATALLILGFGLFSAGIAAAWYIQIAGGLIWLSAGIRMKDKPIIVTNAAMIVVGVVGKFLLNG